MQKGAGVLNIDAKTRAPCRYRHNNGYALLHIIKSLSAPAESTITDRAAPSRVIAGTGHADASRRYFRQARAAIRHRH